MNQIVPKRRGFYVLFAFAMVFGLSLSMGAHSVAAQDMVAEPDMAPEIGDEPATPMAGMFSALNPANWSMPDFKGMLPGTEEKTRIKQKKDGLFTEVKQTATNSWTKTKEVFNPQKLNPVNYFPASSRTPSTSEEEEKPGFFRSLFTAAPAEEPQTETVQDFLKQPRPN